MKKNTFIFLFATLLLPAALEAQIQNKVSWTLGVGSTLFFGDLGGANYIGRPLFFDLERSLIRPVGTIGYHRQVTRRWGYQIQASYTGVAGDDKLIQPHEVFAPEWFRYYRNLNFESKIWEVSIQAELYLVKYEPGSLMFRVGPYLLLGVGVFHFNPKANYNGTTVDLRPLHTEGQGFPGSDVKEYSLFQPCIPVGAGIRYNLTNDFTIGFEYADRKTFTDYIDDVSTDYVAKADFDNYFSSDPSTAALAYDLSVQSEHLDPDGIYSAITAPGQQRGDNSDLDHYIFAQFNFAYTLGQKKVNRKSQMKCMKWGGEGGQNTGKKR